MLLRSPTGRPDTDLEGRGYSGIIAPHPPCSIVITGDGTTGCGQTVRQLFQHLDEALRELAIDAGSLSTVQWGELGGVLTLNSLLPQASIKVLVIVGDQNSPKLSESSDLGMFCKDWARSANNYILPVVQEGTDINEWLPDFMSRLNSSFWSSDDFVEVVNDILYVARLDPCQRVFISYKRRESSALSMQLFEALSKESVAVFVDRISVPKARDFQAVLTEHLADKSLVLILESADLLSSKWVQYEINFAKANGIRILAIRPPNMATIDQIEGVHNLTRIELHSCEFVNSKLTQQGLRRVIRRVLQETRFAYLKRLFELKEGLMFALKKRHGLTAMHDPSGIVLVQGSNGQSRYGLWATPVLPDSLDFFRASRWVSMCANVRRHGCIVSPAQPYAVQDKRAVMQWLSSLSSIRLYTPSQIHDLAAKIRRGTVL